MITNSKDDMLVSPQVEDGATASDTSKNPYPNLKLGADGLPLVPQPTDHKDDPLVSTHTIYALNTF